MALHQPERYVSFLYVLEMLHLFFAELLLLKNDVPLLLAVTLAILLSTRLELLGECELLGRVLVLLEVETNEGVGVT